MLDAGECKSDHAIGVGGGVNMPWTDGYLHFERTSG